MNDFYARAVFYVNDAERSLSFYMQSLGFALDWNYAPNGRAFVFQVSLLGFSLILNEAEEWSQERAGRGRVFIGLADDQLEAFRQHLLDHNIETEIVPWGEPTLLIRDPDDNWITFWLPDDERGNLEIGTRWP